MGRPAGRIGRRAALAALAATLTFGASQAAAAVTIEREVPVDSSNPYTPVPDGSVWTTYVNPGGNSGTVLHLDGQNGSILASFTVAENGYLPRAIGYANNRVYIAQNGGFSNQIISLQVNGPSGTTNPGFLASDAETGSRLGSTQIFMRVSPDGTGNVALGQQGTVGALNLSDLTAAHPFYPQQFFGAGINDGDGSTFEVCHIDGPGTGTHCATGGGGGGPAPGQFDYPTDMAPDSANGFFVTEYNGNTVSHVTIDANGTRADYNFGSGPGSAAGQLNSPDSIRRIPQTGRLVISNPPNGRIDEFSPTGDYERSYGFGVFDGADEFQTCGVGIGQCHAATPYQTDPRSYFTQLDMVDGKLWAATELDHSIQVINLDLPKVQHILTVSRPGTGTGTVSSSPAGIDCGSTCSHAYDEGTQVTLTASPDSGSTFDGWSGGGCSGTGTCTVTLGSDTTATAVFTTHPSSPVSLTISKSGSGSGLVSSSPGGIDCGATCNAQFDPGTPVTLTATPDADSTFNGWSGGGCSGTGPCTFTIGSDTTVTGTFNAKPFEKPPNTKIGSAVINQQNNSATFTFKATGGGKAKAAGGFQCALVRKHKKAKFKACTSPKKYKHLKKGKYAFEVRAFDAVGKDPTPAKTKFKIT